MNRKELVVFLATHELNNEEFAELLGVTRQAVHHWMVGTREISLTVSRLCKMFDKRPELMSEFRGEVRKRFGSSYLRTCCLLIAIINVWMKSKLNTYVISVMIQDLKHT